MAVPGGTVTVDYTKYFDCHVSNGVFKHLKWRYFYVRCPKLSLTCNAKSGAFVSAITVCNQQLWYNDFGQDQGSYTY
jgi:hypothetical protein